MTLDQLLPELAGLSRTDKFKVVQSLISELAIGDDDGPIESHRDYPVWSPYHADEAAAALLQILQFAEGDDVGR